MTELGTTSEEGHPEEVEELTEGADLSSLNVDGRALLDSALDVLRDYHPQPGALSDLPQVTVERQHILDVCRAMKNDGRIGGRMLLCLTAVDYPPATSQARGGGGRPGHAGREATEEAAASAQVGRLEMVYVLQSLDPERTIVLKTEAPYDDPVVPSVTSIWRAADWYEREAHDLFGVVFNGHPDLSPLLLYDGFEGYPGRKEFPFYEYREF